ncbi:hypothetical protein RU97_GL001779 [Enterococcus canis]|uniref:UPF0473 protein RU97_GL001779 n=1 Tax=Enterococcus canis TaxID=214095 RepID=A0A1L8RFB1_9ENTE|nr:DUF1292 domain-containing protein [Enterococcus canis]OJG18382.1 hypothetical protein RU97_GL001779 [Enterococcus canis]
MTEHHHDHDHDHHHDHEHEPEYITLVDDEGAESLYEVLLTIDGQEEYGKNYVLLYPAGIDDEEDVELQAYAYIENEDGTEGELQQIETDAEWDMIEEVFNTFMAEEEE